MANKLFVPMAVAEPWRSMALAMGTQKAADRFLKKGGFTTWQRVPKARRAVVGAQAAGEFSLRMCQGPFVESTNTKE